MVPKNFDSDVITSIYETSRNQALLKQHSDNQFSCLSSHLSNNVDRTEKS